MDVGVEACAFALFEVVGGEDAGGGGCVGGERRGGGEGGGEELEGLVRVSREDWIGLGLGLGLFLKLVMSRRI